MWAMCLGDYARRPGLVECYFDVLPVFASHDDVIRWKHFPRNWPFVRGIHRSPVNSSHKGQWRGALMFSLMCAWIHGSVNTGEAGDLRRHRAHYGVTVMPCFLRPRRGWRRCTWFAPPPARRPGPIRVIASRLGVILRWLHMLHLHMACFILMTYMYCSKGIDCSSTRCTC